ncbi:olfactory receptor 52E4-like [Latimeria chalumnae]|uniref:olfactory receptor 52E4-like n=1 Tax=Latimeria chalumnae TaxID=7897 RepID=UPI00313C347C
MLSYNSTRIRPREFLLIGFPGLQELYPWLSIPFCTLYVLALVCNSALLLIITVEHGLHEPMYFCLCVLASADLILCTSILPKLLAIFWFDAKAITFGGCFTQMAVVHFFTATESAILVVMAYDRYVAICKPLLYSTIITNGFIMKLCAVGLVRNAVLLLPQYMFSSQLSYCASNEISHCFCDHFSILRLACMDTATNSFVGLIVSLFMVVTDIIFIMISYFLILRAVIKLASTKARQKAFNTCASHFYVILYFYTALVFSILTKRFGKTIPSFAHILIASSYILVPPALNPLIYGVRTKEIRQGVLKAFKRRVASQSFH